MLIKEIVLEKLRYGVQKYINLSELSRYSPDSFTIDHYCDELSKDIVFSLERYILGKQIKELRFPLNWKESLKERFLPNWLKRKYPIKYTIVNATVLYPDIRIPKHDHILRLKMLEEENYKFEYDKKY